MSDKTLDNGEKGNADKKSVLAGWAPLAGVYGVSFAALLSAAAVVAALRIHDLADKRADVLRPTL